MEFVEELYRGYRQVMSVSRVLYQGHTGMQSVVVFEAPYFGRVLALDGVLQLTTADEWIYHEMFVHPALVAHGAVRRVLIIGGGDGGCLREVLRYPEVQVTLVDIDAGVLEVARTWFPDVVAGGFEHPRAQVIVQDGLAFIRDTRETYDVILIDATDPGNGPGTPLFTPEFLRQCGERLTPGGVLVTQTGGPFVVEPAGLAGYGPLRDAGFADTTLYLMALPCYVGGAYGLGWATDDLSLRQTPAEVLAARVEDQVFRYWSPAVHQAAFVLPPYLQRLMAGGHDRG